MARDPSASISCSSSSARCAAQRSVMPAISSSTKRRNSRAQHQIRRYAGSSGPRSSRALSSAREHRRVEMVAAHHQAVPGVVVDDVHVAARAAARARGGSSAGGRGTSPRPRPPRRSPRGSSVSSAEVIRPSSSMSSAEKTREGSDGQPGVGERGAELLDGAAGHGSHGIKLMKFQDILKEAYGRRRECERRSSTIRGLVKTFGSTRALDGLDLTVAPGEVHGFLGPERRRQVHDDPDPARPDPQGRRRGAAVRRRPVGRGRRRCTAGSPTCPATSACGPTSAAAR